MEAGKQGEVEIGNAVGDDRSKVYSSETKCMSPIGTPNWGYLADLKDKKLSATVAAEDSIGSELNQHPSGIELGVGDKEMLDVHTIESKAKQMMPIDFTIRNGSAADGNANENQFDHLPTQRNGRIEDKSGQLGCLTSPNVPNSTAMGSTGDVKQVRKWSEVTKANLSFEKMKFQYHTPEVIDGKIIIKPPLDVDLKGRRPWMNCLVGYFFEKRVAFHTMEFHANRRWKNRGLLEVMMNDDGFFFFKFGSEEDLLAVLEEEACMIEGKPLILQRWHPQIVLSKNKK